MTGQDGQVIGMSTVVDHEPANLLLNIVVVSEGFREQELPEFAQYVRRFANYLFTFPPLEIIRFDGSGTLLVRPICSPCLHRSFYRQKSPLVERCYEDHGSEATVGPAE